jgi:sugar lactone lactonase YvrE
VTGIEVLTAPGARLGESPVWDSERQCLWWIDIVGGLVHRLDTATGAVNAIAVGLDVGALALCDDGGLLLALPAGIFTLAPDTGRRTLLAPVPLAGQRFNDGTCDPRGRFWTGTLALDRAAGVAALYRVSSGGRVSRALGGITVSNGIGFTADGTALYYVDSVTQRIDIIGVTPGTGALGTREPFATLGAAEGTPDGLAVDADGGVWVAVFGGGKIVRFDPDGRRDAEIALPVSHPTSVAFGGPALDELYITSATRALTPDQLAAQPAAGAVLRIRPGATGRLPNRFRRRRRP